MKAHYRTETGRLVFELEGDTKDIFAGIAGIQEVFEADSTCGCCGKNRLRFRVRSLDANEFYEFVCLDCRAVLAFGQTRKGSNLFARRKDGDRWLPERGWKVWQPSVAAGVAAPESETKPAVSGKW